MSKVNKIMSTTENTGKGFLIDDGLFDEELFPSPTNDFIGGYIFNIDLDEEREIIYIVPETGTVTHKPFSRVKDRFNYILTPRGAR